MGLGQVRSRSDGDLPSCAPVDTIPGADDRWGSECSGEVSPAAGVPIILKEVRVKHIAVSYGRIPEKVAVGSPSGSDCEEGLRDVGPEEDPTSPLSLLRDESA